MGLCGRGKNDISYMECKTDLVCFPFPPDFFEVDWGDMVNEATSDQTGYTSNSAWGEERGERAEGEVNPFSDLEHLRGKDFKLFLLSSSFLVSPNVAVLLLPSCLCAHSASHTNTL
jgi:hypothetical protein